MMEAILSRGTILWLFWWVATRPLHSIAFRHCPRPLVTSTQRLAATAMEQLKAQQAEARRMLREESVQRKYHEHLDKIAAGDKSAIKNLLDISAWNALSHGLTVSPAGYAPMTRRPSPLDSDDVAAPMRQRLDVSGFEKLDAAHFDWDVSIAPDLFSNIAATMDNLVQQGWPPVFIFMYDEPWQVCCRLFEAMRPLMQDDELLLEHSMYAWALHRPEVITDPKVKPVEKVGVNFGTPHRDITYSNCHGAEDGKPDILSLWIPVVPVSTENGCMYVIPRENDPQFDKDVAKKDQDPFSHRFPYEHVTPLAPLVPGSALVWHPNLIHWGSSCRATSSLPPRKSIAMAFRVRDSRRKSTEKEISRYGRVPLTWKEMLAGGPDMTQRIQMIAKALMLYNVWYPEYEGFDLTMITATEQSKTSVTEEQKDMIREANAGINQKKINV